MSEEIKDLLETLVFMERNNLDHLIRTGQAIKWRKAIEQLQQENKELKDKQNKFEKDYKEMIEIQGQNGNYNYDSYMLGLYNGMEYIISLYENREPTYKNGKDIKFLHEHNILTEFEKWLEKYKHEVGIDEYVTIQMILDKLQELKEGKK